MKKHCMILLLLAEVCSMNAMDAKQETNPVEVRQWFLDRFIKQGASEKKVPQKTCRVASTKNFEKMDEIQTGLKSKREAIDEEVDSTGGE